MHKRRCTGKGVASDCVRQVLQGLCVAQERVAQRCSCNSRRCRGFPVAQVCCTSVARWCRMLHVGAWHKVCVAQEPLLQQLCVARRQSLHESSRCEGACCTKPGCMRCTRGCVARGQPLHKDACTTGGVVRRTRALLAQERCTRPCELLPPCFFPKTQRPPRIPPPGSGRAAQPWGNGAGSSCGDVARGRCTRTLHEDVARGHHGDVACWERPQD